MGTFNKYNNWKERWIDNFIPSKNINKNNEWNNLCIICDKDVKNEKEGFNINCHECKLNPIYSDYKNNIVKCKNCYKYYMQNIFEYIYFHCKECSIKYNKKKEFYRKKAYQLLKCKNDDKFCKYTDCNKKQLKNHIETLFDDKMNWINKSIYWEIDHKIPVCWFYLYNEYEIKKCCSFINIQPMEKNKNNLKGGNLEK